MAMDRLVGLRGECRAECEHPPTGATLQHYRGDNAHPDPPGGDRTGVRRSSQATDVNALPAPGRDARFEEVRRVGVHGEVKGDADGVVAELGHEEGLALTVHAAIERREAGVVDAPLGEGHRARAQVAPQPPGLDVLEAADAADPKAALEAFVARMRQGSDDTIPLVAKKGRAMRLGERSVGHRDPGSQSSWMLMNCLLDQLKG